jgi:hypothetical protein
MPELWRVVDERPDILFDSSAARTAPRDARWYHHRTSPDGEVLQSLGRIAGGFLLQFKGCPRFYLSESGSRIECRSSTTAPLRHLLLNQILPHALGLRGYLTLHASVVGTEKGAIAFMGNSGGGKSTLIAALLAKGGARLIADDCLIVRHEGGQLMTVPSYPCLRLRGESWKLLRLDRTEQDRGVLSKAGGRRVFGPGASLPFERQPVPFHRLYMLAPVGKTGVAKSTPVPPRQAFVEAMAHGFQLHTSDPSGVAQGFHRLADLMLAKAYRLHLPWSLGSLPRVATDLLDGRF